MKSVYEHIDEIQNSGYKLTNTEIQMFIIGYLRGCVDTLEKLK